MPKALRCWWGVLSVAIAIAPPSASAQFEAASDKGPKLDQALTKKFKFGVSVRAVGGPCSGIIGTIPVPTDWPEQRVQLVQEDISPGVRNVRYRTLDGGAKQMVISIPHLSPGEEAHAYAVFEVTRHSQLPPEDTSFYKEPQLDKLPKDIAPYLGVSPYIESKHPKIVQLAKVLGADRSGWDKVEALYDGVRERVEYKNGPLKGALKGLLDGTGDCEELTSLFIAVCRASGIPARTVWVPEHCYPEFYLVDSEGNGHWFPCQAAGARAFGGIPEHRPILQKGDNFRDPDRPKEKLRLLNEFLKGNKRKGDGKPQHEFVQQMLE